MTKPWIFSIFWGNAIASLCLIGYEWLRSASGEVEGPKLMTERTRLITHSLMLSVVQCNLMKYLLLAVVSNVLLPFFYPDNNPAKNALLLIWNFFFNSTMEQGGFVFHVVMQVLLKMKRASYHDHNYWNRVQSRFTGQFRHFTND